MTFAKIMATAGLAVAMMLTAQPSFAEGDAEEGEKVYRKCKACHEVDKERNKLGPHLVGIFGRKAGGLEDYRYSDAMKDADIVWDEETLAEFLADPRGYVPGTKMSFSGLNDEEDMENLLAYLKTATE